MNRIISALDAIIGPLPEEMTTAVAEAPATFDSMGGLIFPAIALVAVAALGIIFFTKSKKTDN